MGLYITRDSVQASLNFVLSQTTHIEREVNRTVLPEIQYPFLVPVDTSAPAWAPTVTFYSEEIHGKAKWFNANSDDIPIAGADLQKHESSIYTAAVGYGWGYEEIKRAQDMGYPLQANDAIAARRAAQEMIERIVFEGDPLKGMEGLINHSAVTAQPVVNGNWATANEYDILQDVNTLLSGGSAATLYTSNPNTLLVSPAKATQMMTRPLGDTGMTLFTFLAANNTVTAKTGQPLLVRAVRGLETAGVGGVERMVAYRRDPSVLKMHLPLPHQFLPIFHEDVMNWVVPGIFRTGGIDIRRPAEIIYGDGI